MFIIKFLKNPFHYNNRFKKNIKFFLFITISNILINFISLVLLNINDDELNELFNNFSVFEQFLIIGFLFPIIEEILFRYPLQIGLKNLYIIFFITLPICFLLIFGISIFGIIFLIVIIFLFCYFRSKITISLQKKYFKHIFYGLSLAFSFSHLNNFSSDPLFVKLFMVSLVFVSSLFFGSIRLLIGFKYSIYSHILYNCFFISLNFIC